jgi:tetratricopeptide (TPR) repeat protein
MIALAIAYGCGCPQTSQKSVRQAKHDAAASPRTNGRSPSPKPEAHSLLGRPLFAPGPLGLSAIGAEPERLTDALAAAEADLAAHPDDPARIVWVGRRLGYLWRMNDAIDVYTKGITRFPTYAPLYRHRGHRYISVRQFDKAIADLEKAVELIRGRPDEVEQDGMPNARNLPLTTTAFNVWYHLGVAHYLKGDNAAALTAFQETMKFTRNLDDNVVAVTDWTYLTMRRLGRHDEAAALLARIQPSMDIIENKSYHQRLLMYKGLVEPPAILDAKGTTGLDFSTLGYGAGYWYLHSGQTETAMRIFQQVIEGLYWPAFGYIAAEAELARERARTEKLSFRPRRTTGYPFVKIPDLEKP